MLIRRFFAFVISAFLIFFPAYSYANTSVGGWTALDTVTAGATNTINATKTAGGKVLKSAITIAPQAGKVGKYLLRGGAVGALALAVPQLLGEGVEWVLDPDNDSVKYFAAGGGSCTIKNSMHGYTAGQKVTFNDFVAKTGITGAYINSKGQIWHDTASYGNNILCTPAAESYMPIDTVAAQVISNAEAGHPESQEAVQATALEGFAAGEHDAALDAAATEAGTDAGTENPPDTENPPKDPDAPAQPFDPAGIISAINALKALLAGILSSMTGFFDWAQAPFTPPEEEKGEVGFATTGDVGLDEVDRFEQRIDFAGQCPVNDFSFTMMGVTYAKPIPYHHLCGFLEQIAPWLLAMCYLGVAYFVVENI